MKISIIGGGGRVGADAAFALQFSPIVQEMVLVDVAEDLAAGEALDLLQGSAYLNSQKIYSGSYEEIRDCNCIIITAGLRRKPDESRLELINRNVSLFHQILDNLKKCKVSSEAILLVVSNPVDILTSLASEANIVPQKQVLGLGTVLDTCRFRSMLASHFQLNPTDLNALILGEHGDSMVPIWSTASVNGLSLSSLPGFSQEVADSIFQKTKKSGAEVIRLKGGAGRAVGVSIKQVIEAIGGNTQAILPVSSVQEGALGICEVSLSLPTKIGEKGILEIFEPKLSDIEFQGLKESAKSLSEILDQLKVQA